MVGLYASVCFCRLLAGPPCFKPTPQPPVLNTVQACLANQKRARPSSDPPRPLSQEPRPPADPLIVTEERNDIMRAGLLSKTIDHISLLIEDYFQGVRPKTLVVPCPHCSQGEPPPGRMQRSYSEALELLPPGEREVGQGEESGSTSSLAVLRNDDEYSQNRVSLR